MLIKNPEFKISAVSPSQYPQDGLPDINSLKNTNEEIIKSIARIKVIYDIQIVIIAIGFKVGNELLSNLFELGIYDFIISEDKSFQDEEFRKAMKGNNYIDSVKFKIEDKTKKVKKTKIKKWSLTNC